MKTNLTYEQTQHLIELGIPKERASIKDDRDGPALFTLTDLFEILPKEIDIKKDTYLNNPANLIINGFEGEWGVEYEYMDTEKRVLSYIYFDTEELIDSLYELCIWCLENKYI